MTDGKRVAQQRPGGKLLADALVAQGANQIEGPTLTLDRPDAALDEARADAVARARARAELEHSERPAFVLDKIVVVV